MAEDFDDSVASTPGGGTSDVNPAALNAAMAGPSAATDEARAFLREQEALTRLQAKILREEHALELSHLKWRRYNDWMRSGWQTGLAVLCAIVVAAIATALWDASQADGLVVDAFSSPPEFAQQGLSGDTIADDVVEKLSAIRSTAMRTSYSITNDVSADRANDIKVDIPETGVSVSDAWRYLRRWLGHERHLTGNLRKLADGRIALSLSLDGAAAMTEAGKASDLPALEQKAAEDVFGAFDPVNHINYLTAMGRRREAMDAAARFVPASQGVLHADAYTLWAQTTVYATGDTALGLARANIAINIYPQLAVAHVMTARFDYFLGHGEAEIAEARTILSLNNEDQPPAHRRGGFAEMQRQAAADIALLQGDFANALYSSCSHTCTEADLLVVKARLAARLHDIALAKKELGEGMAAGETNSSGVSEVRFYIDAAEGNWRAAAEDAGGVVEFGKLIGLNSPLVALTHATFAAPLIAVALSRAGRFADAEATIDGTPRDCVACVTARGDVEALQQHWGAAAAWFASATKLAPSVPFAYTDWGAMLLREGKFDAAIAKFRGANMKGPHFADPLEMWGEALMQENRSDLALAKFEEANRYAPNWGQLHLEWGKALIYAGRKDEARKQLAIASSLDLSPSDKAALAKWRASDGRSPGETSHG